MQFATQWIYKYCKSINSIENYNYSEEIYKEAQSLLVSAMDYSNIFDFLVMLHKNIAIGTRKDDVVTLTENKDIYINKFKDVADQYISGPDIPDNKQIEMINLHKKHFLTKAKDIKIKKLSKTKIKYTFSNQLFLDLRTDIVEVNEYLWTLDRNWDLGGYTVNQFKNFWQSLQTLTLINYAACLISNSPTLAIDSSVLIKNKQHFIRELSQLTDLDLHTINSIFTDITYNPLLYKMGHKQPDVIFQPIFPLTDNIIAISCSLVNNSNAERNIWDLLSIIKPKIHSKLSSLKESIWITELSKKLSKYNLEVKGPLNFSYKNSSSDVDLLIYDKRNNFILATELKWLIDPHTISDVYFTGQELQKGIEQAAFAQEWIDTKPEILFKVLGVPDNQKENINIQTIVLSKNTLGPGWLNERVPIANERLLDWVVGDKLNKDLKTLWRICNEKKYLPTPGKHFEEGSIEANFAGIKFISRNLSTKPLQVKWTFNDINVD